MRLPSGLFSVGSRPPATILGHDFTATSTCPRADAPSAYADLRIGAPRPRFVLRLLDGPGLEHDDPLLRAFAAVVVELLVGANDEALQHGCFDPGRRVRLEPEPFEPHDPDAVGVWDLEGVRKAGELPGEVDAVVSAALEQALPMGAVVLWEERERLDERRTGLNEAARALAGVRQHRGP